MKKIILILLLFCSISHAQIQFRITDWNKSSWTSWDKEIHCLGGWVLTNQIDKKYNWAQSFLIGQVCSLAWEVKDGFIKWENAGSWGGDGFDIKDHICFTGGQLLQGLFDHVLFKKTIYSNNQLKRILKKRLNKNLYRGH